MLDHIGRKPGGEEEYLRLPYLEGWQPLQERQWAAKYVREDGSEDFQGFYAEYQQRLPAMFETGAPGWVPPSVDYFLRHDHSGRRLDVDWELASVELSDEEKAEIRARQNAELRARRMKLLNEREEADEGTARAPAAEEPPPPPQRRSQARTARRIVEGMTEAD